MGHASHFLSRLERLEAGQTDLALSLYRDVHLVRGILLLLLLSACNDADSCSKGEDEGSSVAWDRISGQVAYARWQNPISPGGGRGCVYLIDARAARFEYCATPPSART